MSEQHLSEILTSKISESIGSAYEFYWDPDEKGITTGWFQLTVAEDICKVAKVIAELKGRVMAITASVTTSDSPGWVELAYHFAVGVLNCTFIIGLPGDQREIESITPILKSADWQEREMQELYNIRVRNHPNPKRLFLEENMHMADNLMIPLSEAMNGNSTATLWERVMQSKNKEVER
ncbi:hypothetical protein SCACP_37310 [Sporomusa carbonis]|uniref:NADH-quinone oxidoreductase subunit C n=1 Tax=Sporomusa carbonis TaxID=3076075 RepID=UPI003A6DFE4A